MLKAQSGLYLCLASSSFYSHFYARVLIIFMALTRVFKVRLNNALALYDPLFIIPLLQANFIFFAIIR